MQNDAIVTLKCSGDQAFALAGRADRETAIAQIRLFVEKRGNGPGPNWSIEHGHGKLPTALFLIDESDGEILSAIGVEVASRIV